MADKLQYQFDFLTGKNNIVSTVDSISTRIKLATANVFDFNSMFKTLAVAGAGLFTVSKAIDFIGDSIKEASEAEDNLNRLNVALQSAGVYSKKASDSMLEFASTIQKTTTFSDDQVLSASAMIETLTNLDVKGLQRATTAAINLSSALKIDLETASTMIGKSAEGNIATFQRYGLAIQKGKTEAETFANTLKVLEERFGGRAQSEINTFSGALKRMENIYSDLKESIGNLIIRSPVLAKIFNYISDNIIKFTAKLNLLEGVDPFKEIIKGALSFAKIFNVVVIGTIEQFFNSISWMVNHFKMIVQLAISSIAQIFGFVADKIELVFGPTKITTALKDFAESSTEIFDKFAKDANESLSDIFNPKFMKIDGFLTELENQVNSSSSKLKENGEKIGTDISKGIKTKLEIEIPKIEADLQFNTLSDKLGGIMGTFFAPVTNFFSELKDTLGQELYALVGEIAIAITQGKQGAIKLFGSIATKIGTAVAGPLGVAFGPLAELMAQGPEAVREAIKGFANAVPEIVQNFIESIPVLVEELSNALPLITEKLTILLTDPNFWIRVGKSAVMASFRMLISPFESLGRFIREGFDSIGKIFTESVRDAGKEFFNDIVNAGEKIVNAIIDGIKKAVEKITGGVSNVVSGGGSFLGNIGSAIGGVFGFAKGGHIKSIPAGYPNDSYPINVQSGELIVDSNTTAQLKNFLNGGGNDVMIGLLNAILNELRNPMQVETSVQLNNQTLADIILNLNRNNARLV